MLELLGKIWNGRISITKIRYLNKLVRLVGKIWNDRIIITNIRYLK